ncbi:hypothetical protein [Streptomyces sp. NPDC085479]|uniref:hypothetical protein n=1 Tax=Streptomyces sp. NPDC085479 TaxID=3365726 RepID=UPI0037D1B16A
MDYSYQASQRVHDDAGCGDRAVTSIRNDHVKVHFRLETDGGDWPPASVESLWAADIDDGAVRLDNTPWFVRGVASRLSSGGRRFAHVRESYAARVQASVSVRSRSRAPGGIPEQPVVGGCEIADILKPSVGSAGGSV